jgi:hypothetical protein
VSLEVITAGHLNLTDTHIYAENFYRDFLHLVYGWNLENLNEEQANIAAIDLGDREQRKAIQVTSDNSLDKIRNTLEKFVKNEWHKEFDELIFVRIGHVKKNHKKVIGSKNTIEVSIPECVIGVPEILQKIQNFSLEKMLEVQAFLEREVTLPVSTVQLQTNRFVDAEVESQITILRQYRFFSGSKTIDKCKRLITQIEEGELSSCTQQLKDMAYCWCARLLASSDYELSKSLVLKVSNSELDEIRIAEAFILSSSESPAKALAYLPPKETEKLNTARLFLGTQKFLSGANTDWSGAYLWIAEAGFTAEDFCPDGKGRYLQICLHSQNWETALKGLSYITDEDYTFSPLLHYLVGTVFLAITIPEEFRQQVLYNPPIYLRNFPIETTDQNLTYLEKAAFRFSKSREAAASQNLTVSENISDQFFVWITLRNPVTYESGIEILKKRLRSSERSFSFINFAYEFNLPIESEEVEKSISKNDIRGVDLGFDGAIARLTLAKLKTPIEAVGYLLSHRESLIKWIPDLFINSILIDLYSGLGRRSDANKVLSELEVLGAPQEDLDRLSNVVNNIGGNQIETFIEDYNIHGKTETLINLCRVLERVSDWVRLLEYSEPLFARIKTVPALEWLCMSLHNLGKVAKAKEVLSKNQEFLEQSNALKKLWASTVYSSGNLTEAKILADKYLSAFPSDPFIEDLRIQISITSGNWSWLNQYLMEKWNDKELLSAQKLMNLAKLSQSLKFDKTKEFVTAAIKNESADAQIFLDAFMIANNEGWDEDPSVGPWLGKAIELSGDDGPVQKFSLDELVNLNPEWGDQRRETYQQLKESKIPSFIAAKNTNSCLFSFIALEVFCNQEVTDLRRKSIIRAYSPKRITCDIDASSIAFDATAILTFGLLDILPAVKKVFDTVYIPHSMLRWLFEEKQKLEFNQANQSVRAERLLKQLANERLRVLPLSKPDSELSLKVGIDLANFLVTAHSSTKQCQSHLVAIPKNVYLLNSLMKEFVDLAEFKDVTCHCIDLVEYLELSGSITAQKKNQAVNFLSGQSEKILSDVEIKDGTTLYLSALTVSYLESMNLLEKLCHSKLDIVISAADYERARGTSRYRGFLDQALSLLEKIRKYFELEIASGFVKVGPQQQVTESGAGEFMEHPSISITALSDLADALIIDDPFLNQHRQFTNETGGITPIFTSLDFIKHLEKCEFIDRNEEGELKTQLRKFGYICLVPDETELRELLLKAVIRDGKLIQSAELKTLRQSITHMQIRSVLNMPGEYTYLANLFRATRQVIVDIWNSDSINLEKEIRSSWLVDIIDLKAWSSCYQFELGSKVARNSSISFTQLLISNGALVEQSKERVAYFAWLDRRVIQPLKSEDPAVYKEIVEKSERDLEVLLNTPMDGGGNEFF